MNRNHRGGKQSTGLRLHEGCGEHRREVDPGGAWQNHYFLLNRTLSNTPVLHTLAYEPPVGEISLLRC